MIYLQPKIEDGKAAPTAIYASVYILYLALICSLGGGAVALIVRLSAVLNGIWLFRWLYYIFSPIVIWLTILSMLGTFGLIFVAVTLQLPVVMAALS